MGGWETRRLLMSQPTSLKTNCTSHGTVSGNHSSQTKRKHHVFPVWEDRWARWSYQWHLLSQLGSITGSVIFKSKGRQVQFKEKPDIWAEGAGGLVSRSPYLGSWTGAIMYSVSCAGGPQHSSWQKAVTCQVISGGQKLPLSPPPSHPPPFHHSDP